MRLYSMHVDAVSVSAVQDLFNLTATANMALKIHSVYLGQKTQTTVGGLGVRMQRMPATVTAGSGGSVGTIKPIIPSDAAATATGRINDTTGMTTSGTAEIKHEDVWNLINGFFWMPAPAQRPVIKISEGFAVQLRDAPGSAIVVSGTIIFEELF